MSGIKGFELNKKIRSGEKVFGTFISITDPNVTRIFAQMGFDFLIIDMEHSVINPETLQQMLLMFEDTQTCPIVRVPWHEPAWTKWALDCGAEGILFPNVSSAEQAQQVVSHCKYPPKGSRGFFPKGASNFLLSMDEYMQEINERIQVWVQIETQEGIDNMDDILLVSGIDSFFIGPADLAMSLGVYDQYQSPQFKQGVDYILNKAAQKNIPAVYHLYDLSEEAMELGKGKTNIISFGFDIVFLQNGVKNALKQIKDNF